MATTKLLIPIDDAVRWEWLEEALWRAAEEADAEGYDGGEEEGDFEVHRFDDMLAEEVRDLVAPVLARGHAVAVVTGKREVTVRT
jgi:hypothetical protein